MTFGFRCFIAFCLFVCAFSAAADGRPDTHAILAKQSDFVTMTTITDTTHKRTKYQIEICPTNGCYMFEGPSSSQLEDYVYLYSAYVGRYVDFSKSLPDGRYELLPYIDQAIKSGDARRLLDSYADSLGCTKSKELESCVLKGLRKTGRIKRYDTNHDEGGEAQTLAEDDGR